MEKPVQKVFLELAVKLAYAGLLKLLEFIRKGPGLDLKSHLINKKIT